MIPNGAERGVIMLCNEASPGIFLSISKGGSVCGGKKGPFSHLRIIVHQDNYCTFSSVSTGTYINFNQKGFAGNIHSARNLDDNAKFFIRIDVSAVKSDSTLMRLELWIYVVLLLMVIF